MPDDLQACAAKRQRGIAQVTEWLHVLIAPDLVICQRSRPQISKRGKHRKPGWCPACNAFPTQFQEFQL